MTVPVETVARLRLSSSMTLQVRVLHRIATHFGQLRGRRALCYKSHMPTARQGSIRLFRFSGIDVFLHWSWFLVAVLRNPARAGIGHYSSMTWNVLEYLALFLIVTLHEFGHSLACRQVGGQANQIILWPLGGVAYVNPPQRPGATLWSIAAGPLVNVVPRPHRHGYSDA